MKRLYAWLLYLYPRSYRLEYGEEMLAVFELSLREAAREGVLKAAKVIIRELIGLPKAALYEHLRQQRKEKMMEKLNSFLDFAHGSGKEFLIAVLPFFLLCGAIPLLSYLGKLIFMPVSIIAGTVSMLVLSGLFIILFILGLNKGLPRWSLPYLGFVLSVFSVYVCSFLFMGFVFLVFPSLYQRLLMFRGSFFLDGIFWYGLLVVILLMGILGRQVLAFQQFREDWTRLSFVVYGATPFALWLTFDEYVGDEPYKLMAFLVLALGAWFFLHQENEWKRLGVLLSALTLAMLIGATGKAILVPSQDWPLTIDPGLARSEAKQTIMMGMWLVVILIAPLVIKFLPRSNDPSQVLRTHGQEG